MRVLVLTLLIGCGGGSSGSDGGGPPAPDLSGTSPGPSFLGTYNCTGSQTNVCDGAHLASGTYSLTSAICPMMDTAGASATMVNTKHKDGLVVGWNLTDATHATLAATVTTPDFANPAGPGTIHNFMMTSGTMTLGGTLDIVESGSFQWVHTTGMENCTFTQTYTGPPPQ